MSFDPFRDLEAQRNFAEAQQTGPHRVGWIKNERAKTSRWIFRSSGV